MTSPLDRLRTCTGFEWDSGNAEKNWELHRVTRHEGEQVFLNHPLVVAESSQKAREDRLYALGKTMRGRRLFVVFTIRGESIRVISDRDMSRKERRAFESHEEEA